MDYINRYLAEVEEIIKQIKISEIKKMISLLLEVRNNNGRVFFLGVGGGAGNASHAVNDFRKISGIEAYAPTENVSELTARVNDDGWENIFLEWLRTSKLRSNDMVFVFSVGGGNLDKNISVNIVRALEYAESLGCKICGVVGRDGGYTAKVAHACIVVPSLSPDTVTPHTESIQAMIWHLLVSHPDLCVYKMKWESVK